MSEIYLTTMNKKFILVEYKIHCQLRFLRLNMGVEQLQTIFLAIIRSIREKINLFVLLKICARVCIGGEIGTANCFGSAVEEQECNETCHLGRCAAYTNVLGDAQCLQLPLTFYCENFFVYMRDNCALACCSIGILL